MHQNPACDESLIALRGWLRDHRRIATTLGYGPGYLHSTGQLHKGGPDTGLFLLLTTDPDEDLPIPGEPYGFGTLQRAQALGDHRALVEKGRPRPARAPTVISSEPCDISANACNRPSRAR